MNGKLWRCAPSQLRHGTERERAQQELLGKTPWTFNRIVADVKIGEYTDVTLEGEPTEQAPQEPPAAEPGDTQVGDDEPAPRRRRITKVWAPQNAAAHSELRPSRKAMQQLLLTEGPTALKSSKTRCSVPIREPEEHARIAMEIADTAFFSFEETPDTVIEIAFPAMENPSRLKAYLRNPELFVVTSLRKKRGRRE
jgi:hypothetical protein